MRDHCRETPVGAADGAVPFPKMRTECQCQANDEPRKRNVRSGVESAASMPIALQRTCHVFPLPVGRSRVASFVEVYAPSNRPQPLGDSRNAGASLAERLLGGPAGSAEKRVLRAGKRQGLDVAARPTLPSTRRCAWMAPGRGIEGHENDVAALGVGRNDGARLALTVIAYVAMPPTSTNRISAAWSSSGSR